MINVYCSNITNDEDDNMPTVFWVNSEKFITECLEAISEDKDDKEIICGADYIAMGDSPISYLKMGDGISFEMKSDYSELKTIFSNNGFVEKDRLK